MTEYGYVGKILKLDLSSSKMSDVPTSDYASKFIGGLGVAIKIAWDELPPGVGALDPENVLMFMTGPLGGVPGLAGSRWLVCGKSPETRPDQFCTSAAAGSWGAYLKFSGYDGIVVKGKAEKPVYLLIQDGVAELRDASALWGMDSIETRNTLKKELGSSVRVAAIGPAGEHMVPFAIVLADEDAAASAGFGAVMGSKNLKAIAVGGSGKVTVAQPDKLDELHSYFREVLPGRPKHTHYVGDPFALDKIRPQVCFGCSREFEAACHRSTYTATDGETGKFMCAIGHFYVPYAFVHYGEYNDVPFKVTKLMDRYGLHAHPHMIVLVSWLSSCFSAGALTDESTGLPLSRIGSFEFMDALVKKISYREGFGDILAQGLERARELTGGRAKDVVPDNRHYLPGHQSGFDPRLFYTTAVLQATTPRRRMCESGEVGHLVDFYWERWAAGVEGMYMSSNVVRDIAGKTWGSEIAADFSTYEGKALAAKLIQDRYHAFDSLVLCSWAWPIYHNGGIVAGDHIGDTLTLESRMYSAVTGNEIDQEGLYRIGERIFNLERALLVRDGRRGRQDDRLNEMYFNRPLVAGHGHNKQKCWVPGKNGEVLIKGGVVVDREKFKAMMDEYYQYRGWDVNTGLQTEAKLQELGLGDVATELKQKGMVNQ